MMVSLRIRHNFSAPTLVLEHRVLLQWNLSTRPPQAASEPGYSSEDTIHDASILREEC